MKLIMVNADTYTRRGAVGVFQRNVPADTALGYESFYRSIYCGPVIGDQLQRLISLCWTRDQRRALELGSD